MKTVAIVAAGGVGRRLGYRTPKPFIRLAGKPLVLYCLETLEASNCVDSVLIAVERSSIKRLNRTVRNASLKKVRAVVEGGRDRSRSVRNCLELVDMSYDVVLVHDAARPFVDADTLKRSIRAAGKFGACLTAVPEVDTVKEVRGGAVTRTLDRSVIWRAQTPQAFRRSVILGAYKNVRTTDRETTDDSTLVELQEKKVRVIHGSYMNIKITTRDDLAFAEAIVRLRRLAA
ncbi:MAG: 2-C-methyl-D-erythritol 4-phosphate cytidylyltransferase [Candidatus Omnitrophota bacterium]